MCQKNKKLTAGRLVEAITKYRDISYSDLAKIIGEHPANVYAIFNGRRRITRELTMKLAEALSVPPIVLFTAVNYDYIDKIEYDDKQHSHSKVTKKYITKKLKVWKQ